MFCIGFTNMMVYGRCSSVGMYYKSVRDVAVGVSVLLPCLSLLLCDSPTPRSSPILYSFVPPWPRPLTQSHIKCFAFPVTCARAAAGGNL
jgi:hypothetical protein